MIVTPYDTRYAGFFAILGAVLYEIVRPTFDQDFTDFGYAWAFAVFVVGGILFNAGGTVWLCAKHSLSTQ